MTSIFAHTSSPLVYIRTDVGGAYRLSQNASAIGVDDVDDIMWQPLMDSFTPENSTMYGIESLALDPSNDLALYAAVGWYADSWGTPGYIMRSSNGGATWEIVSPPGWPVRCGSNDNNRWSGEKLLVHPTDNSTVLFGSRDGHLWITRDAFGAFSHFNLSGAVPVTAIGIQAVAFVTLEDGTVAALAAVYTGTAAGGGIWASLGPYEKPTTWQLIPGSPMDVMRMKSDGSGDGIFFTTGDSGVHRCVASTSINHSVGVDAPWSFECALVFNNSKPFSALDINPHNPLDIIVAPCITDGMTTIHRSVKGGTAGTWFAVNMSRSTSVPWYPTNLQVNNAASQLAFDPFAPNASVVYITDWYGTWRTTDFNASLAQIGDGTVEGSAAAAASATTHWMNHERGHEEVCVFTIACPPVGVQLLSGHADVGGFAHVNGLQQYPDTGLFDMQYVYHIDYTESTAVANGSTVPEAIVIATGNGWSNDNGRYVGYHQDVAVSFDGGKSSTGTQWDSTYESSVPQKVAVNPYDKNNWVVTTGPSYGGDRRPSMTTDGGQTYHNITELPYGEGGGFFWSPQPLVSDRQTQPGDNATFYHYFASLGSLYASHANGVPGSWSLVHSKLPSGMYQYALAVPSAGTSAPGDVWMAFGASGLYRTTDGGKTTEQVQGVTSADIIAIGPLPGDVEDDARLCAAGRSHAASAASGAAPAGYAVYLFGIVGSDTFTQAYVSVNMGASWTSLHQAGQGLGDQPSRMTASRQQPGMVFVGTGGRGIFYYNASAEIRDAVKSCVADR